MDQQSNRPIANPNQPSSSESIKASLRRVLTHESLRNERKFAYIRALILVISVVLDGLVFLFPALIGQDQISPSVFLISLTATLVALGIVALLHRKVGLRYLAPVQIGIPLFDGGILALFITNIWRVLGQTQPQIMTNITAFCCVLAISGGIRFTQQASGLTTLLALVNFAYAAYLFKLDSALAAFALFTILGTGLLGMFIASIVRRNIKNEAGKVLMTRFLPSSVVDTAFEDPLQLLEQPRVCNVTVMFTDLRGFTHYSEQLDPANVMAFLSQFQGNLAAIVERHEGCVISFMGDGMMAVFGAPHSLENHAEKALQAAITMMKEVTNFSPLPMGIGLHSGSVVAGCLGMDNHLEFSVIGDTVNVASRIESLTKQAGYPLLISQTTQAYLSHWPLKTLGPMAIRGRQSKLELFTLA